MTSTERYNSNIDFMRIYESLQISLQKAGGRSFTVDDLLNKSAFELLCLLSPNNIRFSYNPGRFAYTPGTGS